MYGFLGQNGAGKSTTIRMLLTLIKPTAGEINFFGNSLDKNRSAILSQIGAIVEKPDLYKYLTAQEHLNLFARLGGRRPDQKRNNDLLQQVGLLERASSRVGTYSQGMRQRLALACALVNDPKLLILDEPLSGFDPVNIELILQELKEMKAAGKTIILSTHNMKSVEEICDRAALIHQSKLILEGKVATIQHDRKKGDYAVRFRGNMIAFVNALWTGFELLDKEILGEDRFVAKLKMRGDNSFEDLLRVLIGQVQIEAAWEVLPSMQDIFIEMVSEGKEATHA